MKINLTFLLYKIFWELFPLKGMQGCFSTPYFYSWEYFFSSNFHKISWIYSLRNESWNSFFTEQILSLHFPWSIYEWNADDKLKMSPLGIPSYPIRRIKTASFHDHPNLSKLIASFANWSRWLWPFHESVFYYFFCCLDLFYYRVIFYNKNYVKSI